VKIVDTLDPQVPLRVDVYNISISQTSEVTPEYLSVATVHDCGINMPACTLCTVNLGITIY